MHNNTQQSSIIVHTEPPLLSVTQGRGEVGIISKLPTIPLFLNVFHKSRTNNLHLNNNVSIIFYIGIFILVHLLNDPN